MHTCTIDSEACLTSALTVPSTSSRQSRPASFHLHTPYTISPWPSVCGFDSRTRVPYKPTFASDLSQHTWWQRQSFRCHLGRCPVGL